MHVQHIQLWPLGVSEKRLALQQLSPSEALLLPVDVGPKQHITVWGSPSPSSNFITQSYSLPFKACPPSPAT
jgi:hypothetical protein